MVLGNVIFNKMGKTNIYTSKIFCLKKKKKRKIFIVAFYK